MRSSRRRCSATSSVVLRRSAAIAAAKRAKALARERLAVHERDRVGGRRGVAAPGAHDAEAGERDAGDRAQHQQPARHAVVAALAHALAAAAISRR